ncbi:hypothetical protein HPB52_011704 [Rhipicephalus sanguineus]|uniref:Uncharacterized protein n=1 Tax=Rhipicephalus sanguineus TaxID=34632 RepID=A0A9D4SW69_RHISA|nr:hypothetical protein HPB52_011704 [Rhipicephalus sanguineus]
MDSEQALLVKSAANDADDTLGPEDLEEPRIDCDDRDSPAAGDDVWRVEFDSVSVRTKASVMPIHHPDVDSHSPGNSRRPGPATAHRRQAVDYRGFQALYKENRALLEEVEAMKREEKPRKSMFTRGVQKLLSVPDGQPVFPGFGEGMAKVGSLFALEGPFRRQPARVLSSGGTDSADPQPQRSFTRLATVIVVAVGVVFVASAMLFALLGALTSHPSGVQAQVCKTSDCRLHALYLSYRQNHSVRRCNDFQAYVCSEWEPPEGYSLVANTTISEVVLRWMQDIRRALQDSTAGGMARHMVLSMLDGCMADRKSTHQDAKIFRDFMYRLNLHWPGDPPTNVSALSVLIRLAFKWQVTFWMKLRVIQDPVRRDRRRLVLSGGDQDAIVFLNLNHKQLLQRDAYVQYWKSHYAILYRDDDVIQNHVVTQMYESATLQSHVIETLLAVARKYPKSPAATTVGVLRNYTGDRLTSSQWLQFLREHVNPHSDVAVSEDTEVLVSDLLLLKSIGGLFTKYSDADIIRQLSWEFVQLHVIMMDKTPLEIAFASRWYAMPYVSVYCTRYVETVYRPLLASVYVRQHLSVDDRRALDSDVAGLVNAVIEKVNGSSWFEEQGKREAIEKLRALRTSIWPPEAYFDDDELEQAYHWLQRLKGASFTASWIESFSALRDLGKTALYAATVHLHNMMSFVLFDYDYLTNNVHIAISALTNPIYYPHGSRSMFYGGLGFLYTSQLFKSIDDTGRRVRANGTVTHPWPLSEKGKLGRKSHCQGAGHDVSFLSNLGALEVAHAKFLAMLPMDGGKVVSKSYTEEQVFFLTVCRILCEMPSAEFGTTTCNSLFRNSPEFAEAFHCPPGSPMNPIEKCKYYASSEN